MESKRTRLAILTSVSSFENFYGAVMHLTCEEYLRSYRNDFSFVYAYALGRLDVDVIIYVPSWKCSGLHQIDRTTYICFLPLASWYNLWLRFALLSKTPFGRYISQLANVRAFSDHLKRSLAEEGVSTLYVQEYWTARFDFLVRAINIPVIAADHGGRRTRQLTFCKRRSFELASAITCQTEDECSQVRLFGKVPHLLPNGVDTGFYSPSLDVIRTQTILIVARLTDGQKRVSDLIRAMDHLSQPWCLRIAGTGPDLEKLRRLAADLGVAERVEFLGFIGDKSLLLDLYRKCGVFCMPSTYEGLPLAILEAMSCECSVVVTDIRAFGMVENDKTGYKVPTSNPRQLAAAIDTAFSNRERIGPAAREAIKANYSLDSMANRLSALIHKAGGS